MQVTETLSEGLKREFKVVVPAAELDAKVNARLDEMKDRVRINGFRPGKVPVAHLKRLYGRSAMAEVIEATVRDANNQIVSERGYKLAAEPKVTLPTEEGAVEKLIAGESDLDYTMAIEIVPPIELADFKTIKLTKLVADVTDAEIDEGIARIAEQNRPYAPKAEGEKAAKDDRVIISFAGTIDGTPFEGGTGDDAAGADRLEHLHSRLRRSAHRHRRRRNPHGQGDVPGALSGSSSSPARTPSSTSPPSRSRRRARSRSTTSSPSRSAWNRSPSCATRSRSASRASMPRCRGRSVKRALLDELDKRHKFEPPPTLVEEEFDRVWKSVLQEMENEKQDLRRREHHRGKGQGRIPRHRRAPRAARPGARRDRREEQHHRDRRRTEPRRDGARAPVSRPGAAGVGLLTARTRRRSPRLRAPIFEEKVVDFLLELAR